MDDEAFSRRLDEASKSLEDAETSLRRLTIMLWGFWIFVVAFFVAGFVLAVVSRESGIVQPAAMAVVFSVAGFNVGVSWQFARVAKMLAHQKLHSAA